MAKIKVQDTQVTVIFHNEKDYKSLTEIAKYKSDDPTATVANWMGNRNTVFVILMTFGFLLTFITSCGDKDDKDSADVPDSIYTKAVPNYTPNRQGFTVCWATRHWRKRSSIC